MKRILHFGAVHIPPAPRPPVQRFLGTTPYWLVQIALWVIFHTAVELITIHLAGNPIATFQVASALAFSAEMIIGTHLARLAILTVRSREQPAWRIALVALGAAPLCGIISVFVGATLAFLFFNPTGVGFGTALLANRELAMVTTVYSAGWIGLYCAWTLLQAFHSAENARLQAAAAAKDAELIALKAQLNPHFLFNSLNTLRALVPRDQTAPREAITMLADLLRAALTVQASATIPLHRELETIDAYLALEQLRFEERLRLRRIIDPACLDQPVPPFALQTLVENAVKFGIAPRPDGGEIALEIAPAPGAVRVRITNPGRIAPTPGSTGVGLQSVRQRIARLFGARASFSLSQAAENLVSAELILPQSAS